MPFHILPLTLADFDTLIADATTRPLNDDLVAQPVPLCWPVYTQEEAHTRLSFHMRRQKRRFVEDPSVRFMKVVDVKGSSTAEGETEGEILSLARWHRYPHGYNFATEGPRETWHIQPREDTWPSSLKVGLHNFILTSRDSWREAWIGTGTPCWILMHLVTRQSRRGEGAAGMLIEWGLERALEDGLNAYLEAGIMGMGVYRRYGFEQIGEVERVDLGAAGEEGEFVMGKMIWYCDKGKEKEEKEWAEEGDAFVRT